MKESFGPTCLIFGHNFFLGFPLSNFLLEKGCRVIWSGFLKPREKNQLQELSGKDFYFQEKIPGDFSGVDYLFFFFSENQKDLEKIIKASQNKAIKILVIAPWQTDKEIFTEYQNRDLRIVRFFDVYGPRMNFLEEDILSRLFNQSIIGGPLKIPGEGWEKISPLYVDDLIEALAQAMFSPGTVGKIFDLGGEQPISLISLAYLLQKQSPLRPEIEYIADTFDERKATSEDWQFLDLKPKVSLEEGIDKTLDWFSQEEESSSVEATEGEKPSFVEAKGQEKRGINKWLVIAFVWIILLLSPFFFYGSQVYLSWHNFNELQNDVLQGDLNKLTEHARKANYSLAIVQQGFDFVGQGMSFLGFGEQFENLNQGLTLTKNAAEGIYHLSIVGQKSGSLFVDFIGGGKIDPQVFSQIQLELDAGLSKLSFAQTIFPRVKADFPFFSKEIEKAETLLPEVNRWLVQAREMSNLLPKVLFAQERKTYLILFQNNMELRPTGGFIGSFGLLTIEKGKLLDFEIHDVYFADGQLKGHVEPPAKLKEFIGQAGWYLRDSNWSPDFPTSARRAEWFLDKEIGRKVDGVIAIDLFLAQRILEATGEIYLPDYDEKINADNLFERAEYHSEIGFFPGSTQKQDFLGKTAQALFEKLKSSESKNLTKIGFAFFRSLEEKDILIYLEDESIADFVSKFNWDGGVKSAKCKVQSAKCLADYVYINEANVGINKANYFLNREIEQAVVIDAEGKIKSRLIVNYQNNSPNDVFPAGNYRNYLRVLLPLGSQINRVEVKNPDKQQEGTEIKQIDHETDFQREIFGFLIEVPVKERRKVEIEYQLEEGKKVEEGGYLLLVQKQSGTKNDQYSLSISYPQNLVLTQANPQALTREGMIVYNTALAKDTVFEMSFIKK